MGEFTEAHAERACVEVLGARPTHVTAKRDVTFLAEVDGRTVVVKFARASGRSTPLAEAWAYDQCRRLGVRAPEVLGTTSDPECIVTAALPGQSLWKLPDSPVHATAWAEAGRDLRALHEIALEGFGQLQWSEATESPTGMAKGWSPFLEFARDRGLPHLGRHGVIPAAAAETLARRLDEVASEVAHFTDGRLLHGDLEGGHIYVHDDAYVGLIDFDQSQAGDPRWDLARVPLWDGDAALDALLVGYGGDAVSTEDREVVLPAYLLAFVVHHAVRIFDDAGHERVREIIEMSRYERLL